MAKVLDIPDLLTEHEYTVLKKLVFFCSLDEQHVSRESATAAGPAMNIMNGITIPTGNSRFIFFMVFSPVPLFRWRSNRSYLLFFIIYIRWILRVIS